MLAKPIDVWVRSRECCRGNLAVLSTTYGLIARSRRLLNPAFGMSGAADDTADKPSGRLANGVIYASLQKVHADRIVVGEETLYLTDGLVCSAAPGAYVEVIYTDRRGRREVHSIRELPTRDDPRRQVASA